MQTTLTDDSVNDFAKKAKFDKKEIDKELSLAIGTSTASNCFVHNMHFRKFVSLLSLFFFFHERMIKTTKVIAENNYLLSLSHIVFSFR